MSSPPAPAPPPAASRGGPVSVFARHPVAYNLLMLLMILAGVTALTRLNTQFFPTFALDIVSVQVTWTGASAEDVETSVTTPLEQELRTLDGLRQMTSTSSEGIAAITLEYAEGTDMGVALDLVKERIGLMRNLPATAEEPEVSRVVRYDPVARVLVTGPRDPRDLRAVVHRMESELLDRGIAKVTVVGLPEEEIAVQVPSVALAELGMSLDDVADRIERFSRDLPAGTVGRSDVSRQLRALEQRRTEVDFEAIPLVSDDSGRLIRLGDVAEVERRPRARETRLRWHGQPAVVLQLSRAETGDSLRSARILADWMEESEGVWPPGVEVRVFDESWQLIYDRIMLLVRNGLSGLVLVVSILFLFLNGRVAWWVAVGIPVSFLAALGVLYLVGGSINMVSLFALIMTLGIIVDDAIVVGEDALTHAQAGEAPLVAAEGGAMRMLAPVLSSSLTTIAAFLPLMLISGIIGNILFDIPLVVVCVLVASLVECFLVLPGHLRHAFQSMGRPWPLRVRLDAAFDTVRGGPFRRLVTRAVDNAGVTLALALAGLALVGGLVAGGRIPFTFFPTAESTIVYANASFVAGTPPERVEAFVDHVEDRLLATDAALGGGLVRQATVQLGALERAEGRVSQRGDHLGSLLVELAEPDERSVRNPEIITAWREAVTLPPGIESFTVGERRAGPPGRDVEVRLVGESADVLKHAARALAEALATVPGVLGIEDDTPYGQEQLIYRLTPQARALGLTVESVGRQLRAAYDGRLAQVFQDGKDEVEVRVMLPDVERHRVSSLQAMNLRLPTGGSLPLLSAVELETRRGFDVLRHKDGRLSVQVSADVDPATNNANAVIETLGNTVLPRLRAEYGVEHFFEGRRADQEETMGDMRRGGMIALAMIYIVLAWVFGSYGWPLVVMAIIPFAVAGAIAGHWLLGLDLTLLSMFGLFGLSGIVVNDSIILVVFYKHLRERGLAIRDAVIEASCQRLRAVLLTSLTTIAGLTPLMFERSLQAQFLIPMAVSIAFGLAFATVLVLVTLPALLLVHERLAGRAHTAAPAAT
ncbi:MAG: efflux RND transporter permease subunit [Ectothiorhodospiraceae bacterium]|nr:efflux RND transporter permease subunit [Ectothiorhodospiraceae bacterium]